MNENKEFKSLEVTWSYIIRCKYVICPNCKTIMGKYVEKLADDDRIDFGDLAQCTCGNTRFDGVHSGII